jgi:hypothetical protein
MGVLWARQAIVSNRCGCQFLLIFDFGTIADEKSSARKLSRSTGFAGRTLSLRANLSIGDHVSMRISSGLLAGRDHASSSHPWAP